MDAITAAVVIVGLQKVGGPAADIVRDFLEKILAPTGEVVGQALAHPIVEWHKRRVERASRVIERAAARVAESGYQPQPVPGRALLPILEKASLEDDDTLQ